MWTACPRTPDVRPRGGGRRDLPRPDPDRHHQLRRRRRAGGAEGGRVRRGAARRGRHRVPALRVRARPHLARGPLGRRRPATTGRCCCTATSTSCPRPPRTGRCDPFSGEIQRRLPLGPRRGRHEGLRRDAAVGRPGAGSAPAGSRTGRSCCASPPTRRPAATRAPRSWSEHHPEEFEGCTEAVGEVGGFSTTVRGRRLYLIEAAEKGMAWMRLTARGKAGHGSMINPRQRGHPARRGGRPDRRPRVAGAADADDAGAAGVGRRARRHRGHARRTPRRWSRSSAAPPGCSARSSATPPTRPCSRPATR